MKRCDRHVAAALEVVPELLELFGEERPLFGLFPVAESRAGSVARRVLLGSVEAHRHYRHASWLSASRGERAQTIGAAA